MKCVLTTVPVLLLAATPLAAQSVDPHEFFEKNVRPVLVEKCQLCHNPNLKTAELDLSSAAGFLHGGASGPLVSASDPQKSKLLEVIRYEDRLKMPPTGKLSLTFAGKGLFRPFASPNFFACNASFRKTAG